MHYALIIFLCLSRLSVSAQKLPVVKATNRVTFNKNDTLYQFYVTQPPAKKMTANAKKFYYWYTQDTILLTQGSFSNRLLHKSFQAFYPNHNLYQEGLFEYGLKVGLWKLWYPTGQLKGRYRWEKGLLEGDFIEYYETGGKQREGSYKDGVLSGKVFSYLPDGKVIKTKYKKGNAVPSATPVNKSDSTTRAPKANQ